jgi:hypothetical protein
MSSARQRRRRRRSRERARGCSVEDRTAARRAGDAPSRVCSGGLITCSAGLVARRMPCSHDPSAPARGTSLRDIPLRAARRERM